MIVFCDVPAVNNLTFNLSMKGQKGIICSMHPINNMDKYCDLSPLYKVAIDIINSLVPVQVVGKGANYSDPAAMHDALDSREFDGIFANAIISNPSLWILLVNVLLTEFNGNNVIIEVSPDAFSDKIVESLIKVIQDMYEYNCLRCMSQEDIPYILEAEDSTFGPNGLLRLDMDKLKYQELLLKGQTDLIVSPLPKGVTPGSV